MAGVNSTPSDFYVYLHRRATDGRVFYVGKGANRRAWQKDRRNAHWKNVVNKHGYTVDIVQDGMQEWWAFELECELIAYYGRGSGMLCNATDGGEGAKGAVRSVETRKKLSETRKRIGFVNPMLGKRHKPETIKKQKIAKLGKYSGTSHPRCSVIFEDVLMVKNLRSSTKMTCKEISKHLDISYHVVRNIVYNKSWKHTNANP